MNKPAILLAFANEREEGHRYLRNLPLEMNRLRAALEKAEDKGLCELVILPNATLDTLIDTFQREKYRRRIAIFHYGGHAGSYELLLEQASGKTQLTHGEGLIPFLAGQKGLQLVFLNGCHSARQAEELLSNGIPAVVGTVSAVDDHIATELSSAFYKALGEGAALEQAWQEATYKIKAKEGVKNLNHYYQQASPASNNRDFVIPFDEPRDQFPWQIHYRDGAEAARDWNLPDAANDSYFGLSDIPAQYGFPEEPYRFLQRYTREDARIFFGRGSYIRDLYHRIHSPQAAPAILLYGQSGVGKSSLLEAGLFPRLEEDYDIRLARRQPETGLLGHLAEALGLPAEETDTAKLLQQWKHLEAQSEKKALIIVLDQVEEVFTRPAGGQADELDIFLQTVSAIFARPDERPAGKLLLSYRKEYDPEVEKACRAAGLPKEKVFLERLDRKGILEITGGLASNQQLQNKYRLEAEKGLPVLIADDLLEDRNSPIAPVLQIILTKLWQQQEEQDKRVFRAEDYQKLKKEGILLDDFFHQQMGQIRAWEEVIQQKVESSGLALDVLHYHTTALGTAESRSLETLRSHYQHQSGVLQQMLHQLQSLYLLAGLGAQQTTLAHDTLAPIVQKEIRDSNKPGQRALRILSSKIADYAISPERTYIDEEDLALVEEGAGGMRMWTAKERELVEKSRKRRAELVAERRRNRRLKIGGAIVITVLAVAASFLAWQFRQKAKVSALTNEALRLEKTDATRAFRTISQALDILPEDPSALLARNEIYAENEFYTHSLSHSGPITGLSLSPDGRLLATITADTLWLWEIATLEGNQPKKIIPHGSDILSVSFSPDSEQILTACENYTAYLWATGHSPMPVHTFEKQADLIIRAVFSPDGQHLLTGGRDGALTLWTVSGDTLWTRYLHNTQITSLDFSKDGRYFLSSSIGSTEVYLWNKEGELVQVFNHPANVTSVAFGPDGQTFLAGCREDATAYYWSIDSILLSPLKGHTNRINSVAFSPDGNFLLTVSMDKTIKLWNLQAKNLKTYRGHEESVNAAAFSPPCPDGMDCPFGDGQYFASGGADGMLRWWKRQSKVVQAFGPHAKGVAAVAFAPDGQSVLSATGNGEQEIVLMLNDPSVDPNNLAMLFIPLADYPAFVWNPDGTKATSLSGHKRGITSLDIAPDNQYLLTGSDDGQALIWNWEGEVVRGLQGHRNDIKAVAFSPDGQLIATAGEDSLAILWDLHGDSIAVFNHPDVVLSLCFSPDGSFLLTGSGDSEVRLWDIQQKESKKISVNEGAISAVAFSPNGNTFVVGGKGGDRAMFSLWNTNATLINTFIINSENRTGGRGINSLAFSPDGNYILAGAEGGIAVLFDLEGGVIQTLNDFEGSGVYCVIFSPDSQFILAGSGDGWARLFRNISSSYIMKE